MNERQFQQMLDNARKPAPTTLFQSKAAAALIRKVSKRARANAAGLEIWRKLARPEWQEHAEFDSLEDGVLRINVAQPVLAYELRRQSAALTRMAASLSAQVVAVRIQPVRTLSRSG